MSSEPTASISPVVEQKLGTLEVADQVFRDIAARALSHVKGVAGVGKAPSGLFRLGAVPPVSVERGQAEVALSVHLTVRYSVSIPDMMRELNERVRRDIQDATGYRVRNITVAVDHILPPLPTKPAGARIPDLPPVPDHP